MRLLARALGVLVGLAMLATLLFFVAVALLYDPENVPAEWSATRKPYPDAVRTALWRDLRGRGRPHIEPYSPPGLAWRFLWTVTSKGSPDAELLLLASTSDAWSTDEHSVDAGKQFTGAVIASHWEISHVLDTALDEADMGNGLRGFRSAADAYFGRPVEALAPAQLQLLLTLRWFPFRDPWCERDTALRDDNHVDPAWATLVPPPPGHRSSARAR